MVLYTRYWQQSVIRYNLTPASFIDQEKDGSYTRDFGHFDYGKWVYSNNQIFLTDYQNNKSVVAFQQLGQKLQ